MIRDRLGKELLLFDGGMGTLLQERGLAPGELPETWNISRPEVIREIHKNYIKAGSDIVLTNTFGANALKFHADGCSLEADRQKTAVQTCQGGRQKRQAQAPAENIRYRHMAKRTDIRRPRYRAHRQAAAADGGSGLSKTLMTLSKRLWSGERKRALI